MNKRKRNWKLTVEVEMHDPTEDPDEVDSALHAIFENGDPNDLHNAVVWVKQVEPQDPDA